MKRYEVTVEIVNRYWAIQVLVDDVAVDTPDKAVQWAQARFDQAVQQGYIQGEFRATQADPV